MEQYKHFSHPHDLKLYQIQQHQTNQQFRCSGCESLCHGLVYGCRSCEFFLHKACATAPRSLRHPSHPSHHLTLLPFATYPDGSFLCNACGATGTVFCFSCIPCDLDLHVNCALLPQQLDHKSHRHSLSLVFSPPSDICNLCRRALDSRYWSYSCSTCNFHVHTYCATSMAPIGLPVGGVRNDGATQFAPVGDAAPPTPYCGTVAAGPPSVGGVKDDRYVQFAPVGEGGYDGVSPAGYGAGVAAAAAANPPVVVVVEDPILKAQAELHELQMQMQIVNEMAKMMASVNLSSLV